MTEKIASKTNFCHNFIWYTSHKKSYSLEIMIFILFSLEFKILWSSTIIFFLLKACDTIHLDTLLTLSWRRPLSYSNHWFLYDNGLRHERVKLCQSPYIWYIKAIYSSFWNFFDHFNQSLTVQCFRKRPIWYHCRGIVRIL